VLRCTNIAYLVYPEITKETWLTWILRVVVKSDEDHWTRVRPLFTPNCTAAWLEEANLIAVV